MSMVELGYSGPSHVNVQGCVSVVELGYSGPSHVNVQGCWQQTRSIGTNVTLHSKLLLRC